jgi:hypothetical protein
VKIERREVVPEMPLAADALVVYVMAEECECIVAAGRAWRYPEPEHDLALELLYAVHASPPRRGINLARIDDAFDAGKLPSAAMRVRARLLRLVGKGRSNEASIVGSQLIAAAEGNDLAMEALHLLVVRQSRTARRPRPDARKVDLTDDAEDRLVERFEAEYKVQKRGAYKKVVAPVGVSQSAFRAMRARVHARRLFKP